MTEHTHKIKEEVENEMVSIHTTILTSIIEEDKVYTIPEESCCHFQLPEYDVLTKQVEMHDDNKVSNEYFLDSFFNAVDSRLQGYYVNCGNDQYVDILYVEDINDYGTKVYTEEMEFFILKDEKMLSRLWLKKNKRKRDPVTVAKMNDKMSKNWKTRKKE